MPALACLDTPPIDTFSSTDCGIFTPTTLDDWSPSLSSSLYKIDAWGAPYFTTNPSGNISVHPHGSYTSPHQEIDLMNVVRHVTDPNSSSTPLQLPLIVRYPDVLKNRLESLQSAFDYAIRTQGYESRYQGVYPVKCNQDRFIVQDIVEFGSGFRFGLEAGSKPEILLAMSCLTKGGDKDAFLVCNGFKDSEYVSLALIGRRLGLNVVIVLEQEEELGLVIELSKKMNVRPVIGLRAKLRTKHEGHFGSTSGEKGKFGLTTVQVLRVVKKLREVGMLDCLELLHFHIGSQIPSTELLSDGVAEAAQLYCELVRLGGRMGVIDIGGGLGIDYDGSKSGESDLSVAYGLEEYAMAVVAAVRFVCGKKGVKHPVICSESGRAIVSHHSVLVFEAVSAGKEGERASDVEFLLDGYSEEVRGDYERLYSAAMRGDKESCLVYVDQLKQRCVKGFKEGSLSIEQLAGVDGLCEGVVKAIGASDPVLTYNVNLSVFTSIPDFWGIDQLFPIVPIHKLEQRPMARGILSDLTCDSDGKINKFIGGESSLPLHELGNNSGRYYLGMFLGGAYEEAIGGVHNLFGGPSVVRVVQSDGPRGFEVTSAMMGQSSADVLRAMHHEPELMFQTLTHRAEELSLDQGQRNYNKAGADKLAASYLARSFNNMPYLSMETSTNDLTAAISSLGVYYRDEEAADDGDKDKKWAYFGGVLKET